MAVGFEGGAESPQKRRRTGTVSEDCNIPISARLYKRIANTLTRPSYLLRIDRGRHIRHEVRQRLALLLRKLMRQHNWPEACGVLSVLLQGTCLDRFATVPGRLKYSASMELLKHIKDDDIDLRKLRSTYDIWIGRMGRTRSSVRVEDKVALHLEYILFTLNCGNMDELYQAALSLMKEPGIFNHHFSSLVIGLSFYVLWYDGLSQELKLKDSDEAYGFSESEDRGARFGELIEYSECSYAACTHEAVGSTQYDSETSVMNDKRVSMDTKLKAVPAQNEPDPELRFHTEGLYSQDLQISSANEAPCYDDGNYIFDASTFSALDCVESWLVPLRLPHTNDEFTHMQQRVLNQNYKEALKYFRLALCATPPVLAALLPLIQLLLVVGRVAEALGELDKFCEYSKAPIPLRIKASLYECLCSNDPTLVQNCFEDVLKKDPTCQQSLARLVSMYHNGTYSPASLVEMIALHLDATYADSDLWKELALCFLALSQYEVDQMSVHEEEGKKEQTPRSSSSSTLRKTPKLFAEGESGRRWRLRCRWWARRHFSTSTFKSEASAGVMELVCYKAACASHMYGGKEMQYVGKAYSYLQEENRKDLVKFLRTHMENSVRIISWDSQHPRQCKSAYNSKPKGDLV